MWGYKPVDGATMAWGARCIFNPTRAPKTPLGLLHDRQDQQHGPDDAKAFAKFVKHVERKVMPKVQKIATFLDTDSDEVFVRHYEWAADPTLVIVAQGSPRASYGYLYLSVSLVAKDKAPAEVKTKWEDAAEKRKAFLAKSK